MSANRRHRLTQPNSFDGRETKGSQIKFVENLLLRGFPSEDNEFLMPTVSPDASDDEDIRRLHKLLTDAMLRKPWREGKADDSVKVNAESKFFLLGLQPLVHGIGIGSNRNSHRQSLVLLTAYDASLINFDYLLELANLRNSSLRDRVNILSIDRPVLCARPVMGGDSVSFENHPTGSIGCVVEDEAKQRFLLSCNHVLADCGAGTRGTSCIWQPGALAGGKSTDRIGLLHDFKPIRFGGSASHANRMDAALCRPDQAADLDPALMVLGRIKGVNATPAYNIDVQKYGWATKDTSGTLGIQNLSILIPYPTATGTSNALFENQYAVFGTCPPTHFSQPGDSGAIVVDEHKQALGMIFAKAGTFDVSYVNPIQPILDHFGVSIV